MGIKRIQPPDLRSRDEGGFWSMPAVSLLTTVIAVDFKAARHVDGENEFAYARAISAGAADVTVVITTLGGVSHSIFILAGTTKTIFIESALAPSASVTYWF